MVAEQTNTFQGLVFWRGNTPEDFLLVTVSRDLRNTGTIRGHAQDDLILLRYQIIRPRISGTSHWSGTLYS